MNLNKNIFQPTIEALGYSVKPEFQFSKTHKFRADWLVCKGDQCCLVEYEGIFAPKSRHTGVVGYSKDCEKYNLAQIEGYNILRYTAKNFNDAIVDLEKLLIN